MISTIYQTALGAMFIFGLLAVIVINIDAMRSRRAALVVTAIGLMLFWVSFALLINKFI